MKIEQANKEDIHREREQAYMRGYEDGSRKYRIEPCTDAINRQEVLEGLACIAKAKAKSDAQKSLMGRVMFYTEQLPSVSTENGAQYLDDIANGKFKEPYTCVTIKVGNETKHVCVVNCSRTCLNPRYSCERNKDACPNCGAKMKKEV